MQENITDLFYFKNISQQAIHHQFIFIYEIINSFIMANITPIYFLII